MATSQPNASLSRRAGRATARAWRWLLFRNKQFTERLIAAGAPAGLAKGVSACVLLLVVGVLLYAAFWFAAAVLILALGFGFAANAADALEEEDEPPQWRNGLLGFGLYDKDGVRIDPYDPNELE
ncbi:DUF3742 family protein [Acidovorax sp. NCPPB 4044]|uniref:DUF3742 family protein n=1 Tax=Acidovorax sp. NCPPB 4044 TaxID=2940490 RepID=UPI002303FF30|nr:DUF3742 family protein [Acidovorax sp. NCPPB 4044]MDA8520466.1 DUF3742 family protein [Acidovorax sp. NCPPB 4044]